MQTEGKLAPYPDGSLWMEAPGARSLLFQQQSAALAAANADGDNSSVGFHSVQSLWKNMAGGGAGENNSVSLLSSSEDYSVKTASHVLQAPTRTRSKPSKVIAKMRRQNMRRPSGDIGESYELHSSHHSDFGVGHALHLMSIEGEAMHGQQGNKPRSPVTVHLNPPFPVAPSPLSLGSSAYLPNSHILPMRSQLSLQRSNTFAPAISVSGQGFVAPLLLPKL